MKLTPFTLQVLSNFTNINDGIVIYKDNVVEGKTEIRSLDPSESMQAIAEIDETFDNDVAMHNLGQFLNVVKMVDEPEVDFKEDQVEISGQNFKTRLTYAQVNEIAHEYKKTPKVQGDSISFEIDQDSLQKILKFADILSLEHIKLDVVGGNVVMEATVKTNPDSKSSQVLVQELSKEDREKAVNLFPMFFNRSKFQLVAGNYEVTVFGSKNAGAIKLQNQDKPIKYFIANLA